MTPGTASPTAHQGCIMGGAQAPMRVQAVGVQARSTTLTEACLCLRMYVLVYTGVPPRVSSVRASVLARLMTARAWQLR